MTRRDLLKSLTLSVPGAAYAQQMFHGASLPTMTFQTTKTTGFQPSFTKTGATLYWKWPDGTYTSSNAPTKTLAAGTKTVQVQSQDGFDGVTTFYASAQNLIGILPPFGACTELNDFEIPSNSFTGTVPSFAACTVLSHFDISNSTALGGPLPSFAACTLLAYFRCSSSPNIGGTLPSFASCSILTYFNGNSCSFSGTLPSFASCTALVTFEVGTNSFSGTIPSFAPCTALVTVYLQSNNFNNVVAGSFATQKSLSVITFQTNALPAAAVNQILADFVVSLGISGRVTCTVITSGGTNAAPTGQGILDKATLIAAGWTVTTT